MGVRRQLPVPAHAKASRSHGLVAARRHSSPVINRRQAPRAQGIAADHRRSSRGIGPGDISTEITWMGVRRQLPVGLNRSGRFGPHRGRRAVLRAPVPDAPGVGRAHRRPGAPLLRGLEEGRTSSAPAWTGNEPDKPRLQRLAWVALDESATRSLSPSIRPTTSRCFSMRSLIPLSASASSLARTSPLNGSVSAVPCSSMNRPSDVLTTFMSTSAARVGRRVYRRGPAPLLECHNATTWMERAGVASSR